jgi:hypothetical protein
MWLPFGGLADSVLQTFENSRQGLTDEALRQADSVEAFFAALYAQERPQLVERVVLEHGHLSAEGQQELLDRIDRRMRDVVLPAYCRIAGRFTIRERNDFYLTPHAWHGAERVAFALAGMALGAFAVWAPFIPLWSKEWILAFSLGGLLYPEIRRVVVFRRYQAEINGLVGRTQAEIARMDLALLGREMPLGRQGGL